MMSDRIIRFYNMVDGKLLWKYENEKIENI
jgi:hypothetical protein